MTHCGMVGIGFDHIVARPAVFTGQTVVLIANALQTSAFDNAFHLHTRQMSLRDKGLTDSIHVKS